MRISVDLAIFLELGADIEAQDKYGNTPLHMAAETSPLAVRQLLDGGANVLTKNDSDETPLESALARARNTDIVSLVPISEMLLNVGTPATEKMRKEVLRIGENFEFHRERFNRELLPETDAALMRLYEIFKVTPVAKRKIHDGVSPIEVTTGPWNKQYGELWSLLIPSSGAAKTVQGEVIRITGRVSDELQRNGGANWDADYKNMLLALPQHFQMGVPLESDYLEEVGRIIKGGRNMADEDLTRLCELAVKWVIANQMPIQLGKIVYSR